MEWIEKRREEHYKAAEKLGGMVVKSLYEGILESKEKEIDYLKKYLEENDSIGGREMLLVRKFESVKPVPGLFDASSDHYLKPFVQPVYSLYLKECSIFSLLLGGPDDSAFKQRMLDGMVSCRENFLRENGVRIDRFYQEMQALESLIRRRVPDYERLTEAGKSLNANDVSHVLESLRKKQG